MNLLAIFFTLRWKTCRRNKRDSRKRKRNGLKLIPILSSLIGLNRFESFKSRFHKSISSDRKIFNLPRLSILIKLIESSCFGNIQITGNCFKDKPNFQKKREKIFSRFSAAFKKKNHAFDFFVRITDIVFLRLQSKCQAL